MTGIENIRKVYFLGIGGIGMSALARWFRHSGFAVAGYDRTPSRLTGELQQEGIDIHFEDLGANVEAHAGERQTTLVVVTPAVPDRFGEWEWLADNGFTILKRSEVLGMICNRKKCLAVAGTHGKTTVSTMAATILKFSTTGCGAFLGGISKNFNSNLILPGSDDQWIVTEADEYDRSFLWLTPDVAVITYMDADHLDIYGRYDEMKTSFIQFAGQIRSGGSLIVRRELASEFQLLPGRQKFTYSLSEDANFCAIGLQMDPLTHQYTFRIKTPSGLTPSITMSYPGKLNVENAVAAAACAFLAGAKPREIKEGLERYTGVKRRFDILYKDENTLFIDDYAHHPEELKAFITSVRMLYPGKKITGIFQPHLYSRTRDFAGEFAQSLDLLDRAILLPIYPARELPIPGVDSGLILRLMTLRAKQLAEKSEIASLARESRSGIVLTMGAGDIELLTSEIISCLKNETGS